MNDIQELSVLSLQLFYKFKITPLQILFIFSKIFFCCWILFFFNLFFIGVQFTNIQNNTQCPSPIHSHPPPSSPSTTLVRFPELAVFTFCLPFSYFPHISSPFPYIPFHYYLYSPNEWEHIMFVLLRLTYFTQVFIYLFENI